jgi:diaminohydroxyphosphoribosylaminopyrimidine deaminase / 5-amino-6-(5-phosphoribosylamino)uracil reductase
MAIAIMAAAAKLGTTWPNPTVGALIVRDGEVLATGVTQPGGRPHAEAMALAEAGAAARGAIAYVTLEPCAHQSLRGPACADSLIAAGIARVVGAIEDPDPRTAGQGFARLQAAGIAVDVDCQAGLARALHQGFMTRIVTGRPLVADSRDGTGFEAAFSLEQGESFEAALDRMGLAGYSRVWVRTGGPLALALAGRGLLGEDLAAGLLDVPHP